MTTNSFYVGPTDANLVATQNWFGSAVTTVQVHGGTSSWKEWSGVVEYTQKQYAGQAVDLMWSIPLIPTGATLAQAAAGAYNDKYLALAQKLAADYGDGDEIYVRLGWEFNTLWNSSSAVGQPQNYAAAYREFVDVCRSVSDKFVFEWTPNIGYVSMNPELAYPGDDYVDVIGIDFYYNKAWDSPNAKDAFDWFVNQSYGLSWQQSFAKAHGKDTAIAEWGLNSDNPEFVQLVAKWVKDHKMLYQNYWNSDEAFAGALFDGSYPKAAEAFRKAFGIPTDGDKTSLPGNGDDTLAGTMGADKMVGGNGDDVYLVNHAGDRAVEYHAAGAGGIDKVISSVTHTLDANVENLTLTGYVSIDGTGTDQVNMLTGNAAANVLSGLGGNDLVYGGGGDDRLLGGAGADRLYGEDGDDTLDGGTGADAMAGGDGNDTYLVEDAGDTIVEWVNGGKGGIDTVRSTVSVTLAANVEDLVLLGDAAIDGTGNAGRNLLRGNEASNTLRGLLGDDVLYGNGGQDRIYGGAGKDQLFGGAGNDGLDGGTDADVMEGGDGDDHYYVDHVGDTIVEWVNGGKGGIDTVFASIDYVLSPNLENLTLVGTKQLTGTGNSQANVMLASDAGSTLLGLAGDDTLTGGSGDDRLEGGQGKDLLRGGDGDDVLDGGTGADTMHGGDGNDTYYVEYAGDTIVEWVNGGKGGVDSVISSMSVTLATNVENLTLTGTANLSGTGNAGANEIRGNAGNNVITGGGGNDVLFGGAGADRFVFGTWSGKDVIEDFGPGDRIDLSGWLAAGKAPTLTQHGDDTFIAFDAFNVIQLHDVDLAHLQKVSGGYLFQ